MEGDAGSGFSVVSSGVRKKRSDASRRPRHDSQMLLQSNVLFPAAMEPFSSKANRQTRNNEEKAVVYDAPRSENKLRMLKLKVGGVTRTIHNKSTADFCESSFSAGKTHSSSAEFTPQEKQLLQGGVNGKPSCYPSEKRKGFGVRLKGMSKIGSTLQKEHSSSGIPVNDHVRKRNGVPKRRVLDAGFDEEDDKDEEIQYLERLKASKNPTDAEDRKDHRSKRERVIFKLPKCRVVMDVLNDAAAGNLGSSRLEKDIRKRSRSEQEFEDGDYVEEEEEEISDEERISSGKKVKKGSPSVYVEGWKESTPTTRNRAMQSVSGSIDLSNHLLSFSSRKKKEKLSELEQQLKKAEAAQRRRMQSEKAAREAEAEAIRKILGQDSGRKKREEKMKKQRDELLQEKAASALTLASNTIRWVNSPTGTIVTFSKDMGLPTIFNSVPCRYPPAREKCAGPNCTNTYKYRDSKLNLPLCSLQCYKAVQRNVQPVVTY